MRFTTQKYINYRSPSCGIRGHEVTAYIELLSLVTPGVNSRTRSEGVKKDLTGCRSNWSSTGPTLHCTRYSRRRQCGSSWSHRLHSVGCRSPAKLVMPPARASLSPWGHYCTSIIASGENLG